LFNDAYQQDSALAKKLLFWARDVRGGAGERRAFRACLQWFDQNYPQEMSNIVQYIPVFGRWDDGWVLSGTNRESWKKMIAATLVNQGEGYQLCAKWQRRQGAEATEMRTVIGVGQKTYRKLLVNSSNTVEQKLCAKEFDKIEYAHLPSIAAKMYQHTFTRHDKDRYAAYLEALNKGETKINAGAIFPHDVMQSAINGAPAADAQWKALPNYMNAKRVLPMIDVSGSMDCSAGGSSVTCMHVAISLGMYIAEKQTGAFKNIFLSFSTNAEINQIKGSNLVEKYKNVEGTIWGGSTSIERALKNVLDHAKRFKVPAEDMPEMLVVLSDMQFDYPCIQVNNRAIDMFDHEYTAAGYNVPAIVFWDLNAQNNVPANVSDSGVMMVSGFSPVIMKSVLAADFDNISPEGIMLATINDSRYDCIK
jgi:hypothetical protein